MDYFLILIALALIVLIVVLFVTRSVGSPTSQAAPTTAASMTAAPSTTKAAAPMTTPMTAPMSAVPTTTTTSMTAAPMQAYQGKHDCLRMCGPECQLISDPDIKVQEAKIKTCFSSCQNKCSA